ncbi:MAG: DNRLRE domain-containing protein, partial [Actinobacteria bacterium]|nr:DNRLRE domain-containing protein [Actinomycetota bacterium]
MVRRSRRTLIGIVSLALLATLAALPAAPAGAKKYDAGKATVVRELEDLRTATSATYLLSNGLRRTKVSSTPIHFKDKNGTWREFDAALVPSTESGVFTAKALPFGLGLAAEPAGGSAATLYSGGYAVGFALEGEAEKAGSASGSTMTYAGVAEGASSSYEVLPGGLEQKLTLTSSSAPNTYTTVVTHPGLELRADKAGTFGFYARGQKDPLLALSSLTVFDSAKGAGELPAFCDEAKMTVKPGAGISTLTYSVPEEWLADPARVYPVTIDPMAYFPTYYAATDTSVRSASPNTSYGTQANLTVGPDGAGYWRSLVRFDLSQIPSDAFVYATSLGLYKYYSGGSNGQTTVARLNQSFTGSSTWNSLGLTVNSFPAGFATSLGTVPAQGSTGGYEFWTQGVDYAVQDWIDGSQPNYGFAFWQSESGSQGAAYLSRYRALEYGSYQPYLWIEYEVAPSASLTLDKANYCAGETATATMTVNTNFPYQVQEQVVCINKETADPDAYRGMLGWFKFNPNTYDAMGVDWVVRPIDFGYLAYEAPPGDVWGTQHITPDLYASGYRVTAGTKWEIYWKFQIDATFGDLQANSFSTYYGLDSNGPVAESGTESWTSGWETDAAHYPTFDLAAQPVRSLSFQATATDNWWSPAQGNNDTNGQGRGAVTLDWPASPGADGYRVKLWDGYAYRQVDSVTATTWSSAGKGLYPSDTQIAAIQQDSTANPFLAGTGLELRDNPNALYQRMGGDAASKLCTFYRFLVVPYNTIGGDAEDADCTPLTVTLDNRSLPAAGGPQNDPQYTETTLGSWNEHSATALLNVGCLQVDVTDLAIASYGPPAELSRSYLSASSAAGDFAPGWFFSFRQNLYVVGSTASYTDPQQRSHVFTQVGGVWKAPNGYQAVMTADGSGWRLTFTDQSYLSFDASGTLLSETDAYGNQTTYAWSGGNLTITAANGQQIAVAFSGGKIASASYATAAGTRTVTYSTASPWRATAYPGTARERITTYAYDGTTKLSGITLSDWPSAGSSAQEQFAYTAGSLTSVYYPDYFAPYSKADARATITYPAGGATLTRYGTVDETPNSATQREAYVFEATGQPMTLTEGIAHPVTTTYTYAFDLQQASATSEGGAQTTSGISTAGDLVADETTG